MKIRHWDTIIPIIADNSVRIMAEVGVFKSRFCAAILKDLLCNRVLDEYWAVDPWEVMEKEATGVQRRREKWQWEEYHQFVCRLMVKRPQLRVLRMTSELASALFPDGYFDLVYIDASHYYEDAKADIIAWLPKVKEGGFISGHDYGSARQSHRGVTTAVNEVLDGSTITLEGDSVWYKKKI